MSERRRLPILVESSLAEAKLARNDLADKYQSSLQIELANSGDALSCHKGCANCCYHPVLITLFEGVSLYQWLQYRGLWTHALRESFKQTVQRTWDLSFEVWGMSLIPCPLLDKNKQCRAYEGRPFACQITYSIGDPKNCHPHTLGPGMLPKRALFEALTVLETPILARHHLQHFRMPLAGAVLYGERIAKGEIELDDCQRALWEQPNV